MAGMAAVKHGAEVTAEGFSVFWDEGRIDVMPCLAYACWTA